MTPAAPTQWRLSDEQVIVLDRPRIMGVLNVTPDSFSDGGRYATAEHAIESALAMIADGADIIDVGGESTRPGAQRIEESRQIDRVVGVIQGIRGQSQCPITIDTTRVVVAEAALDGGATAINDVSGGQDSQMAIADLAAARRCGVILMHWDRQPADSSWSHELEDGAGPTGIVDRVLEVLIAAAHDAIDRGVPQEMVMIDPGLGFGKSVAENLALMAQMGPLHAPGWPILLGASRKSFLGAADGVADPADRDGLSIAAAVEMGRRGGRLFRVHDVAGHRAALAELSPPPR